MKGSSVVTFYSYKGGVSRTFLLANIATQLADWGYSVCCIDWDLEAPGLHRYFEDYLPESRKPGLLHLVDRLARSRSKSKKAVASALQDSLETATIRHRRKTITVDLILAGNHSDAYYSHVGKIDWADLYEKKGLGDEIESLRDLLKSKYDFVLVDSRTGISDVLGICTSQLADSVVFVMTANQQNLDGIQYLSSAIEEARSKIPYFRTKLSYVPIVARFDAKQEKKLAESWKSKCDDVIEPIISEWVHPRASEDFTSSLYVPYYAYWSFGEDIAIVNERTASPDRISTHIQRISALIANKLTRTDMLPHDEAVYIDLARNRARHGAFDFDVFLSYPSEAREAALQFRKALREKGLEVFLADSQGSATDRSSRSISRYLAQCRHLVMLVGDRFGFGQEYELMRFSRLSFEVGAGRLILPVILKGSERSAISSILRQFNYTEMNGDGNKAIERVVRLIRSASGTSDMSLETVD